MGIKRALITGAGSGVGKELALLLARQGVEIIAVGRRLERLEALQPFYACVADITTPQGVDKVAELLKQFVPDLIVNNAGIGLYGALIDQNPEELEALIKTNCHSLVQISQQAASVLKGHNKEGVILNISSVLGLFPTPLSAVYAATKAFVNHFSEALDYELTPFGIRVLVGCPGQIATEFRVLASKGRSPEPQVGGLVLDPKTVARELLEQVQKKQRLRVIDQKYRLLTFLSKFVPKSVVMKLLFRSLACR